VVGAVQFDMPLGPRTEALLKGVIYPSDAAGILQARSATASH
jgi:hypothetical protein